jgi:hypothetical protein
MGQGYFVAESKEGFPNRWEAVIVPADSPTAYEFFGASAEGRIWRERKSPGSLGPGELALVGEILAGRGQHIEDLSELLSMFTEDSGAISEAYDQLKTLAIMNIVPASAVMDLLWPEHSRRV